MSPRPVVTVAVLSPLSVVALGLGTMLRAHPHAVELVKLTTGHGHRDPDVIVYDSIGLLDGDGADLDFFLARTGSSVLVIGQDLRPELTARAMAHGAHSSCSMGVDDESLLAAVLGATVMSGPSVPAGRSVRSSAAVGSHGPGHSIGLTRREVDVLTLITQGHTNLEIAELRYLSINSVKTYIRSAYRRIGVTSRAQAVSWCVQNGFATLHQAA